MAFENGNPTELGIRLLVAVETDANIYQITKTAGISHHYFRDGLTELIEKGFIEEITGEEAKYKITQTGKDLLKNNS